MSLLCDEQRGRGNQCWKNIGRRRAEGHHIRDFAGVEGTKYRDFTRKAFESSRILLILLGPGLQDLKLQYCSPARHGAALGPWFRAAHRPTTGWRICRGATQSVG